MYISSQVKSALRKLRLREGKDRDCVLFMSDVSVFYKSWIAHLAKQNTLVELKFFD